MLRLRKAGDTQEELDRARLTIEQETGGTVMTFVCDVSDREQVETTVQRIQNHFGAIDVLVNNAGIGISGGAEESSVEQARSLFETNVFGTIRMTNGVLPQMRQQS